MDMPTFDSEAFREAARQEVEREAAADLAGRRQLDGLCHVPDYEEGVSCELPVGHDGPHRSTYEWDGED
jgi:hypothetical protein